jgi:hypothetical protein
MAWAAASCRSGFTPRSSVVHTIDVGTSMSRIHGAWYVQIEWPASTIMRQS